MWENVEVNTVSMPLLVHLATDEVVLLVLLLGLMIQPGELSLP
jgi:hypothetical protein